MAKVVEIYGQRIMSNSPCGKCKEYSADIENAFEDFLETSELSYLEKLQVTHDAIKQDRKDLGSELLSAISDGCKTCDHPKVLLDSAFYSSLANYTERISEFRETGPTGEDINGLAQQCVQDLFALQHARRLKEVSKKDRERIILSTVD